MRNPVDGARQRPDIFLQRSEPSQCSADRPVLEPDTRVLSQKSGVRLELKLNKTSKENTEKAESGAYDFLYTNHFFTPERDALGYRVLARPAGPGIRAQVVVTADSRVRELRDLEGKEVAFPTPDGFTGYWVPMDALLNAGVHVKPVFSGNQEASIGLLRREEVAGAGVNNTVLEDFARRTGSASSYRVLWSSPLYNDLCIMANPRVPKAKMAAVKAAFINMGKDPKGRKILEAGAELLKLDEPRPSLPRTTATTTATARSTSRRA